MKILITGANGLLGSNLCADYSLKNEVYATDKNKPNFPYCVNHVIDITSEGDLKLLERIKPELVVHCAALVNVDYCEEHPEEAERVNVLGSRLVAEAAKKAGSYLIHISTDAFFDGAGHHGEEGIPHPQSIYAQTKWEAEKAVQEVFSCGAEGDKGKYAVVRTNIYGWNRQESKQSLAEWMLGKLERGEEFSGFKDVYYSPILVNNLGDALLELMQKNYRGVVHIAGSESCSKLYFAEKMAEVFNLEKKLIKPASIEEAKLKAWRSRNMALNVDKAKQLLETPLLGVEEGLQRFKRLREDGFLERLQAK